MSVPKIWYTGAKNVFNCKICLKGETKIGGRATTSTSGMTGSGSTISGSVNATVDSVVDLLDEDIDGSTTTENGSGITTSLKISSAAGSNTTTSATVASNIG